jgi:hypothetical protein
MIIGNPTIINTFTVSGGSSQAITSDITTTYKNYMFVFTDLNPATDGVEWQVNFSTDDGSSWLNKTTTYFRAQVKSDGSGDDLSLITAQSLDNSTANACLSFDIGNGSDESSAGILYVYNPTGTTHNKYFSGHFTSYHASEYINDQYAQGFCASTSAVNRMKFEMSSGNFDGVIQMYGIK